MTHDSRLTFGQPVFIEGTASTFFQVDVCPLKVLVQRALFSELRGYSIIRGKYRIGLQCHIAPGQCPCSFFWWLDDAEATISSASIFSGSMQHVSCKIKK